ncbi:MAG: hypothetical protein LBL26_04140 [Peptococcaceae bacterium]|jgi:hypothetical protein|nr:hypothetical protein [Peptococcaceae bacterium]
MNENDANKDYDYTLEELLERAKKDESWEPDEKKREQLVRELERTLNYL